MTGYQKKKLDVILQASDTLLSMSSIYFLYFNESTLYSLLADLSGTAPIAHNPTPPASNSTPTPPTVEATKSEGAGAESLKPKFKAFDLFLKERAYNPVDLPLNQSYLPRTLVRGQPNIVSISVRIPFYPILY